jgi:predicted transcriptional regulator YdeE
MILPEPEFVTSPAERTLLAFSRDFNLTTRSQIPSMWREFFTLPWAVEKGRDIYGVSYDLELGGKFSYAIGFEATPLPDPLPEGACTVTLSAGSYAVFRMHGPVFEIPQVFDAIHGTWLPTSGKQLREGAEVERYPGDEEDSSPEMMKYEVWIPIVE